MKPKVVAEFDDSALMKVFAEHGEGVCRAPSVIERELRVSFGLWPRGKTRDPEAACSRERLVLQA